jgi:hypothetical protein
MENFAFVQALRKRGTEKRNKQKINNERSEAEEVKRAKTWPINTETPAFAEPLADRVPYNKSRHQLQYTIRPDPAALHSYPQTNPAAKILITRREVGRDVSDEELFLKPTVYNPNKDRSQELYLQSTVYSPKKDQSQELDPKPTVYSPNNKEKGQQLYQKPGVYSLNDIQSIANSHSKRSQHVYLRRACTEPHIAKETQAKHSTDYEPSDFGSDLLFEYPELAPKPLAFQKNQRSKYERHGATETAKETDEPPNQNRDADRLEYWRTFYNQDNLAASLNKEIDEYVGELMFDRLLGETEMADTGKSTGYRSEVVAQKYWDSIRAYLRIDEDDEDE